MEKILNLTQHVASDDQKKAGVFDLPESERELLRQRLTFTTIPSKVQLAEAAKAIAVLAEIRGAGICMIGGAPFFMGYLEKALQAFGIQARYAFSKELPWRRAA